MPWFNNRVFDKTWSPSTGYLTRKHQQPLSEVTNKSDGNLNYAAIRFADVLLWYAEALNESGHSADALIPLNRVRKGREKVTCMIHCRLDIQIFRLVFCPI